MSPRAPPSPKASPAAKPVAVVAVHMDLGAGRRGVDMGPSAIRVAGLAPAVAALGRRVLEMGSVFVREPEEVTPGSARARYASEVIDVCRRLKQRTKEALAQDAIPITLGGDHSIAMGSIGAVAEHWRRRGKGVGLLWVDAHTDMNVPASSPSGNIHGMPLAHLLGYGAPELRAISGPKAALDPRHVALLGVRSVDRREREIVKRSGVRVYTMSEIDRRGMAECVQEAIERAREGTAGIHLSFDLDAVDPRYAPGVGSAVPGGLTYREAHLVCEEVAKSGALLGMDLVELNPILDERNQTGQLAVELILSALGKTIL